MTGRKPGKVSFFSRGWGFSSAHCTSPGSGKYQDPVFQTVAPDRCNSLSFIYETSDCLPLTCSTCSRRLMYPVVHSELYCRALLLSSSLTSGCKAACWKKKKNRQKKMIPTGKSRFNTGSDIKAKICSGMMILLCCLVPTSNSCLMNSLIIK